MQYCFSKVYVWRERSWDKLQRIQGWNSESRAVGGEVTALLGHCTRQACWKELHFSYCTGSSMLQGAWQVGCSASSRSSRLCLLTPLCWDQSGPGFIFALVTWCSFVSSQHRVTFDAAGSYAVDGLKPDTLYVFSLAARSEMGLGVFTQPIECRTAQSSKYNSTQSRSQVWLQLCSPGEND